MVKFVTLNLKYKSCERIPMLFHLKNPSNPDKWINDWGFVSLFLRLSYLTLASYPPTLLCTESFNLHSKVLRCADSPPIKSLYTPL